MLKVNSVNFLHLHPELHVLEKNFMEANFSFEILLECSYANCECFVCSLLFSNFKKTCRKTPFPQEIYRKGMWFWALDLHKPVFVYPIFHHFFHTKYCVQWGPWALVFPAWVSNLAFLQCMENCTSFDGTGQVWLFLLFSFPSPCKVCKP